MLNVYTCIPASLLARNSMDVSLAPGTPHRRVVTERKMM